MDRKKKRGELSCEHCGNTLTKRQKRFCSRTCAGQSMCKEKVGLKCEQCGKGFDVWPCHADEAKFCSRECKNLWQVNGLCGENNPSWKGGKVKLICKQCKKEFEVIRARADTARFCSRECGGLWTSENQCGENHPNWEGGEINLICKQCKKEYKVTPARADESGFCSRLCMGLWNSINGRGENNPNWQGGKVKLICEQCEEGFEVKLCQVNRARFCSQKCWGLWMVKNWGGENHPNWKGGKSFEPYGLDWTDKLKEEVRKRDDYTCAISGEVWQSGQEKFPVHHINYIKTDNLTGNLITLCIKCHGKTNANRRHWQSLLTPIAKGAEMRANAFVGVA